MTHCRGTWEALMWRPKSDTLRLISTASQMILIENKFSTTSINLNIKKQPNLINVIIQYKLPNQSWVYFNQRNCNHYEIFITSRSDYSFLILSLRMNESFYEEKKFSSPSNNGLRMSWIIQTMAIMPTNFLPEIKSGNKTSTFSCFNSIFNTSS